MDDDKWPPDPAREFPVVEIFGPTLQGEGSVIGRRTMFVRFGYCDGAGKGGWCTWCDTMYAVDPKYKIQWRNMTSEQIMLELIQKAGYCKTVTFSGGNPLLHNLADLALNLRHVGWNIIVETQGTVYRDWLRFADVITVSPKPPSAGEWNEEKYLKFVRAAGNLGYPQKVLKIVVNPDSDSDYEFAKYVIRHTPSTFEPVLQCLTPVGMDNDAHYLLDQTVKLAERVCADNNIGDVRVLPQYHKLLWGGRGQR